MKYSEARSGRVYVMRLQDGEVIHECIEAFAQNFGIRAAELTALGGVDQGSHLIVGPKAGRAPWIEPQEIVLEEAYEATGTGTLFPDESGMPRLHMHLSVGRGDKALTGCIRRGVKVWHVLEVIIRELLGTKACRKKDLVTGFDLLEP